MLALTLHLAAAEAFSKIVRRANQGLSISTPDLLLALLGGSLLALLVFIWVYLHFRKKRQRAEARDFGRLTSQSKGTSDDGDGSRKRRKRRRRAHRPRNPSLQQTGGLPPPRPEDQPPKY